MLHPFDDSYLIYDDTLDKIWYGDPCYFDDDAFANPLDKLGQMKTSVEVNGTTVSLAWDIATVAEFGALNFNDFQTRRLFRPNHSRYERNGLGDINNHPNQYEYHIWGQCVGQIADKNTMHMLCDAKIIMNSLANSRYETINVSEPHYPVPPYNVPHPIFAIATYAPKGVFTLPAPIIKAVVIK